MGDDRGPDTSQRQHSVDDPVIDHRLGHAVNDAAVWMLRENAAAAFLEQTTAFETVVTHASHYNDEHLALEDLDGRPK